jgi:hypothetical protein
MEKIDAEGWMTGGALSRIARQVPSFHLQMRSTQMNRNMQAILSSRIAPMIGHLSAYAHANTLTRLIPDLYSGVDVVSRELVGFIPGVARSASAERAAVGQSVVYHVTPTATVNDIVPAMQIPNPADQTVGNDTMTITKARAAEFGFTGEEQRGLNTGAGYLSVQADMFAQGLRGLVNEVEADGAIAAAAAASRAWGTAGTTPFANDLSDTANVRKILDDNGAPASGRSLVFNTTAGAKFRTLTNVTKVNEAGSSMTLRQGELMEIHGFSLKESAGIVNFTKGTNAGATTNAAGYAIGSTVITLAVAGTGTIKAGDVITFAGDTNKYVVAVGDPDVSNGGTITLAKPGLRQAIPAAATAITTGNSYAANVGFSSNALVLAARAPALPDEGDLALDRMMITDPRSGLSFEVSIYPGYRKIRAEVALAWGWKATKAEHIALMLG